MTSTTININSHVAAMCESTHPVLCENHLAEVRNDGDLLKVHATNEPGPCTMCEAEKPNEEGR